MQIKCDPFNDRATVDLSLITAVAITPTGTRALAPYPPGKVRINGVAFPNGATLAPGDATLTWQHRIRTAQAKRAVVSQDALSTPGTIEGDYTVEVFVGGVLKRTVTGITGTSYTYTSAFRAADDADLTKLVKFRIKPVNGALVGTARMTDQFLMS